MLIKKTDGGRCLYLREKGLSIQVVADDKIPAIKVSELIRKFTEIVRSK